jgi:hypothetical protein
MQSHEAVKQTYQVYFPGAAVPNKLRKSTAPLFPVFLRMGRNELRLQRGGGGGPFTQLGKKKRK